jgi:acyl-CoA thioester hydrolase
MEEAPLFFPVKLPLRIDWSEMDIFGHVNNVAYFKYIQASRVNYWEIAGLSGAFEETKIGPVLVSTGCQFRKPLFYPGQIIIQARLSFIKTTSFGLQHRIINELGELVAEAEDVVVVFDFNKNEKMPLPEWFRARLEELEGRKI